MSDRRASDGPQPAAEIQDEPPRIGRWRAAWRVLRGDRLVPLQIQVEWLEYRQIFDDLLKRFGAQLARQAKAEKKRLERQLQEEGLREVPADPPSSSRHPKAELYRRARAVREASESFQGNRLGHLFRQISDESPQSSSPPPDPSSPSQHSLNLNGSPNL